MEYHFRIHQEIRRNLRNILLSTSLDSLLVIPDGFNNHMFWNIAHCVATQQLLHYYLSENDFRVKTIWIEMYKKGTLPNFEVTQEEVEHLSFILTETSKYLNEDYQNGLFTDYQTYTTSFGADLKSIQDAIIYNNTHESMHLGYVMAQKRALLAQI